MLILSHKENEKIYIGEDIVITVLKIQVNKVKLGILAPPHVTILRDDIYNRIHNQEAKLIVD